MELLNKIDYVNTAQLFIVDFLRSNLIMIYFMSLNYRLFHELCLNVLDKNDGSLTYIIAQISMWKD